MMVKADAIADHVIEIYIAVKEDVRNAMCDDGVPVINFTRDVWTSPNNFGILAVTSHWIDNNNDLNVSFFIGRASMCLQFRSTYTTTWCSGYISG
jgi:hypothetical protein